MKVILIQDIKGVGKKDDIINTNDGYARNYLFPKKLAQEATNDNLNKLKAKTDSFNHKKELEVIEIKKQIEKLEKIVVEIKVKARRKW